MTAWQWYLYFVTMPILIVYALGRRLVHELLDAISYIPDEMQYFWSLRPWAK